MFSLTDQLIQETVELSLMPPERDAEEVAA